MSLHMSHSGYTSSSYVELHAHSFYSFGEGASHTYELLGRAAELGYSAMGLTDHNMCGSLEFARQAKSLGIQPITGGELTLIDGSHVVMLAENRRGYSNISRLFTLANRWDRKDPRLDPKYLSEYSEGVVLLTGCRSGTVPNLVSQGKVEKARDTLRCYVDWFGADSVFVELSRNLIYGDTERIRTLTSVASDVGLPVVATNNVHYHIPERHRLQDALVAVSHNSTIDRVVHYLKYNSEFHLKSKAQMKYLFRHSQEALENTLKIADRCTFDLSSDLGYTLPSPDVPEGYTPLTYLRRLCYEAAQRRYGTIDDLVEARLTEELCLIEKHGLAGFMLLYREIALLAREIMVEMGTVNQEEPLEWRPPGRGRGSSVAMLTGYLIGISHVDPLLYDLTLERFLPDDLRVLPDIDLDFPRSLRDSLIARIHQHFGAEFAVLTGMITTYRAKGVVADLGKAFGIPDEDLRRLSKQIHQHDASYLREEMMSLPEFANRVDLPGWRDLLELAPQLEGAPKGLGQHVGGMILSSSPIPDMVPCREGAIKGRHIIDWDKESVAYAGFAKIDILSLPVLDQLGEAISLVEKRTDECVDLSRIDPKDSSVYDMINQGHSRGVFLLQSPAQLKMGQRLMSRNLQDLAYQVALIRPGVGIQGSGVSKFIERYRHSVKWEYDHPLEKRALERGYGVIVWQEQVVQLISDVSGMSQADADEMRRAFARHNNEKVITAYWERFREGAIDRGVDEHIARKIFSKINGHYMFPESHSHAFAVSAYQAAWMKRYYPLEFFVGLMNNQPMGFYPMEAIKQDARRFGVKFLNPCVNLSGPQCEILDNSLLIGLEFVKNLGKHSTQAIIEERSSHGLFVSVGDFVRRVSMGLDAIETLILAGAFDFISRNRRVALWEAGIYPHPLKGQRPLPMEMNISVPKLDGFTPYEEMLGEYRSMGIYPAGHIMQFVRNSLPYGVSRTSDIYSMNDKERVSVAGWAIARQHPRGQHGTVFVTVEDETSDVQLIVWPQIFNRFKHLLKAPLLLAHGEVSRWDGTTNVIVSSLESIQVETTLPAGHDWH